MGVFFVGTNVYAYGVNTHAFLTKQIIDFYNKNYANKISNNQADFIIDGSRHEDTNPRYLNHFYDPVNNQGLNDGPYHGESAKGWAQNENMQTAFKYEILAGTAGDSILTANELKAIEPIRNQTDFTWQKAIDLYARGNKDQALFAVGHVVHLIEDMAVPDHTRNDAHPPYDHGGSPYENWTKKFNLDNPDKELSKRLNGKSLISLNSLSTYFDSIANYSNNNFYSRDSINKYNLPKPEYLKRVNGKNYQWKSDKELGDYRLAIEEINGDYNMNAASVLTDYWSHLSVKAVQNGAGVLDLFFREAGKARAQQQLEKSQRPFLASLLYGLNSLFGGNSGGDSVNDIIDDAKNGYVGTTLSPTKTPVSTPSINSSPPILPSPLFSNSPKPTSTSSISKSTPKASNIPSSTPSIGSPSVTTRPTFSPTPTPLQTTTPTPTESLNIPSLTTPTPTLTPSPTPEVNVSPPKILISEVQVGGQDAGDEFVELYNSGDSDVDISGWSIQYLTGSATDAAKTVKKNFEAGNKIKAKGFFLVARAKSSSNDDGYTGIVTPDMDHRSFSLSGASTGGKIFLVNDAAKIDSLTDPNIVDQVDYSFLVPENGKSIERKGSTFELRVNPDPQNSKGDHLTTTISSLLKSTGFYMDPKTLKKYIRLSWDSYPFIKTKFKNLTSGQDSPNNWGVVLLYYNKDAPKTDDIFWFALNPSVSYSGWGLVAPGGLKIKYPNCLGTQTAGSALILPEKQSDCSALAGNHASYAFDFNKIEDNNLLLEVTEDNFIVPPRPGSDYVTTAFYSYQSGYEPNNYGIKLVAAETSKHFLENSFDDIAPTKPSSLSFSFDNSSSKLRFTWAKSTDPDSLDNLINYEVKYDANTIINTANNYIETQTQPGTQYNFQIRAFDDFSSYSLAASASYTTPDLPIPYNISEIKWGNFGSAASASLSLKFNKYPFMNVSKPSAMIFFLNQNPSDNYSFLDDDYRNAAKIAGSGKALVFSYLPCDYAGTWKKIQTVAGVFFYNNDCPTTANNILSSSLSLIKLTSSDAALDVSIKDIVDNSQEKSYQFTNNDYITVGFYERGDKDWLGNTYFKNVASYLKKIYFTP